MRRLLAFVPLVALALAAAVHQQQPAPCRAPSCRSTSVAREFMRETGHCHVGTYGRVTCSWPGHVVDHMHPLECGGADVVDNMQWQTTAEAKAKDRLERQCGRWLPASRSDGRAVPHDSVP